MVEHDPACFVDNGSLAYPNRVGHVGGSPAAARAFAYEEISSYLMVAGSANHQTGWSPPAATAA